MDQNELISQQHSPPFGIVGPGDWQSNQPIKPETPAPGPSPPPSGPRRQYTLADINIEIWNIDQKSDVLDHQTNSHPLPPFNDFPGPGGETPYGGEGPNGPIVPKGPKSGRNDFDTADVLEDIKESLHLISRELVENRIKVADILRAVDSINSRLDKHEQNQLYLEKKTVNPLHDLKLGQEIILGKLQALDGSFNDRDAYCTPEPVPQHPFRQS